MASGRVLMMGDFYRLEGGTTLAVEHYPRAEELDPQMADFVARALRMLGR